MKFVSLMSAGSLCGLSDLSPVMKQDFFFLLSENKQIYVIVQHPKINNQPQTEELSEKRKQEWC